MSGGDDVHRDALLFSSALAISLTAGRAFWGWMGENPFHMSGRTYVEFFQQLDRHIALPIALTGMGGPLLAAAAALAHRGQRRVVMLLSAAAVLGVVASVVTVTVHVPINQLLATWDPAALPAGYEQHLHRWSTWHQVRFTAMFIAMCAVFGAMLVRR
jgi:hypothetical protein